MPTQIVELRFVRHAMAVANANSLGLCSVLSLNSRQTIIVNSNRFLKPVKAYRSLGAYHRGRRMGNPWEVGICFRKMAME